MGMRRNPSAAVTVDKDGHFGQGRLDDQGIGNNADIRAKAHKFDALDGIPHFFKLSSKSKGAKSFLFHFFRAKPFRQILQFRHKAMTSRSFDAMRHRKDPAFLRFEVISPMGIEGENDRSIKMGGFFCHAGHNGLGEVVN